MMDDAHMQTFRQKNSDILDILGGTPDPDDELSDQKHPIRFTVNFSKVGLSLYCL